MPKQAACWDKLEKFIKEKYPPCLKILLEKAAYDRLNSLRTIDASKIGDIETYLSEHRSSWVDSLNCCQSEEYKQQNSFHFLPGHKAIMLNLPEQIKQMSDNKGVKETSLTTADKGKRSFEQSDIQLTSKLCSNLINYMKKSGFDLPDNLISVNNIRNYERGSDGDLFICKCKVVCPFCTKVFPVTFKKFWMTSNITKHLKDHITIDYVIPDVALDEENS